MDNDTQVENKVYDSEFFRQCGRRGGLNHKGRRLTKKDARKMQRASAESRRHRNDAPDARDMQQQG